MSDRAQLGDFLRAARAHLLRARKTSKIIYRAGRNSETGIRISAVDRG